MKTIKISLLILCIAFCYCNAKKLLSGIMAKKCQLLSNGDVFWGPKALKRSCPIMPLCGPGFKLAKHRVEDKRYCCCQQRDLSQCPNCEMAYANRMPFWYWFGIQVNRTNGPVDGFCKSDRVKRILMEEGKPDKCCCEPRTSPFVPKEMRERRIP